MLIGVFIISMKKVCTHSYLKCSQWQYWCHYKNMPIQICIKFHLQKTENFQTKDSDIFHISGQNIYVVTR